MTRYLAAAFALTCAVLSTPAPVGACSCIPASSNPCAKAWAVDAVFIAQVVDTSPVESTTTTLPGSGSAPTVSSLLSLLSLLSGTETRNRMRVSERFRGDVGEQVDVHTDSGSCGFGFESDVPYVVYARRRPDGRLTTSYCLGTHRATADSKDLASLRAMVAAPASAAIVGEARSFAGTPLEGLIVIAESDGLRYETTTGRDGQYTLPVPRGSYRVTYGVGAGLHAAEARVDVAHDGSCVAADAYVVPDGRLTGRVVDTTGTPVANMSLFLSNAQPGAGSGITFQKAVTDAEGVYRLTRVRPGLYLIGTGVESNDLGDRRRVFHPGVVDPAKSTRVALELGERKTLPDLVVPAGLDLFTVIGIVRGPSGAPVAGATVALRETYRPRDSATSSTRDVAQWVTTDSEGRFTISALAGRYALEVWLDVQGQDRDRTASKDPFDGAGRVEVSLTLPE